jgi:hypothetical protein
VPLGPGAVAVQAPSARSGSQRRAPARRELFVSVATVKTHVTHILTKLTSATAFRPWCSHTTGLVLAGEGGG